MTPQVVLTEDIHPAGLRLLEEVAQVDVAAALDGKSPATALRSADTVALRARGRLTRRGRAAAWTGWPASPGPARQRGHPVGHETHPGHWGVVEHPTVTRPLRLLDKDEMREVERRADALDGSR